MKLPTSARYAVHLMLEVARRPDAPTSLRQVAERTHISRRCLDQLAIGLRNANLIRGQSGRAGGYRLGRPAAHISVGAIVEATTGPICVVECVRHPEICVDSERCECRAVYAEMNRRIRDALEGMSLADVAERARGGTGRALDPNGTSRPTPRPFAPTPLPHGEIHADADAAAGRGEASFLTWQPWPEGKRASPRDARRWHPLCPHRRERQQGR